jgi:hypothetical protein
VRAFLVVGPESSGTKLTASLLRAAGCRSVAVIGGDDGREGPLEGAPAVLRRSFPHGRRWPVFTELVAAIGGADTQVVVTTREWFAMASSQVDRSLAPDRESALRNIRRAYAEIMGGIDTCLLPFVFCTYEALVERPPYQLRLLDLLGLEPADIATFDANSKWYRPGAAHTGGT